MTYRARCEARRKQKNLRWWRVYRRHWRRIEKRPVPKQSGHDFFEEQRLFGSPSGQGWHCRLGGACPVQGDGECDGVPFYFRARGERWSIEFGLGDGPDGELVGETVFECNGTFGPWPKAGWMSAKHATSLIKASIAKFRIWRAARPFAAGVTVGAS